MDKGNSLKSLSREVVTSAALFTRLMPHCTQERVNQARVYTRHPEPASSSIIPSPPRNLEPVRGVSDPPAAVTPRSLTPKDQMTPAVRE